MAGCDAVAGATGYRWRTMVLGVETVFSLKATTQDPMAMLTGFTAGQTIKTIVEAVNGDVSSLPSDPVQATTT